MTISFRGWTSRFFKGKIVFFYALAVLVLIIILNSGTLVTNGYSDFINGSEKVVCYAWYYNDYSLFEIYARVIFKDFH